RRCDRQSTRSPRPGGRARNSGQARCHFCPERFGVPQGYCSNRQGRCAPGVQNHAPRTCDCNGTRVMMSMNVAWIEPHGRFDFLHRLLHLASQEQELASRGVPGPWIESHSLFESLLSKVQFWTASTDVIVRDFNNVRHSETDPSRSVIAILCYCLTEEVACFQDFLARQM